MSITDQYAPLKVPAPTSGSFFQFESVGPIAIEVWMETETTPGVYNRVRLAPQFYRLDLFGDAPSFSGGLVTFPDINVIPSTVDQISIERNTPITQLTDFSNFNPFHMDLIEFTLDKLTMIVQEIAVRKCNIGIPAPIDQLLTFNPQDVLYPSMITSALNKLRDYCQQMVTNGNDCRNDLENT